MRCKKAKRLIGPYLDGELDGGTAGELGNHLGSCLRCAHSLDRMKFLLGALADLPAVVPTDLETRRLLNRLRQEMASPPTTSRIHVSSRKLVPAGIAAVAILALLATGIAWPLLRHREPAVTVQEAPRGEEAPPGVRSRDTGAGEDMAVMENIPMAEGAVTVRPTLSVSGRDYTDAELAAYREDLGSRLAFYSAYWYPLAAGAQQASLSVLQERLVNDLAAQATAAGQDAEELKRCVSSAMGREEAPLLPCHAELARVNGRECWLISLSGPEDYLLFPDPEVPPSMHMAATAGEESLKVSEALIRDLADRLLPGVNLGPTSDIVGTTFDTGMGGGVADGNTSESDAGAAGERVPAGLAAGPGRAEAVFHAFLDELAAGGTSLDVVASLQRLNYEQLMLLVHGDWASLAREGVNLSDFLVPPKRLWAVERTTGGIVWEAP
ncbi:MAG: zf-HC2 domain-containing protein [Actinobacteria bacterium]|nr:zf-HC2 domain-containing protein [Actinomycetota bacterium]